MKKHSGKKPRASQEAVILLRDLSPRGEVKGGAGKILFGERVEDGGRDAAPPSSRKVPAADESARPSPGERRRGKS